MSSHEPSDSTSSAKKLLGGDYLRLLSAITISNLGNGIVLAAFPLIAASTTSNPVLISGVTAIASLPWLLLGPIAGTIADRHRRRRLIIIIDTSRALAMGLFAVYVGLDGGSLLLLYVVVFYIGLGETVVDTSGQALVPRLVGRASLDRANGRLLAFQTIAQRFAGPMIGGALFAFGAWIPVASDAGTFMVAALLVIGISPSRADPAQTSAPSRGLMRETVGGLRWIWEERTVRALTIGGAMLHFVRAAVEGILVLVAMERLGLGGTGFAVLLAAVGIGYVVGTEMAPRVVMRIPRGTVTIGSVAVIGLAFMAIAVTFNSTIVVILLISVGIGSGFWSVISLSYRHGVAPDRLLGRVLAGHLFVAHGAVPLGAIAGGVCAEIFGLQGPFILGAALTLLLIPYLKSALSGVELDPAKITNP